MLLWVGLGNPEPGMARQRHNIGFMAIDAIARRYGFSPWRQRFKGLTAEGSIGRERILALKPLTYMNGSGESVQPAAAFFKIAPADITAFHDELDLDRGAQRQLGHPDGRAGVPARVAEHRAQQLRRAVHDTGLPGEAGRRRDEPDHLHHPGDGVQPDQAVDGGERGLDDLLHGQAVGLALPADERRAVVFEEELVAGHVDPG